MFRVREKYRAPRDVIDVAWFYSFTKHWGGLSEIEITANINALRRNQPHQFDGTGPVPPPFQPYAVDREAIFRRMRENVAHILSQQKEIKPDES